MSIPFVFLTKQLQDKRWAGKSVYWSYKYFIYFLFTLIRTKMLLNNSVFYSIIIIYIIIYSLVVICLFLIMWTANSLKHQIWPMTCFCTTHRLRMFITLQNGCNKWNFGTEINHMWPLKPKMFTITAFTENDSYPLCPENAKFDDILSLSSRPFHSVKQVSYIHK